MAGITFYGLLWAASANDQIAYHLQIPLYTVTWIFRVLVLAGPPLAFFLTRGICHALADRAPRRGTARPGNRADRDEPARRLHRSPRAGPALPRTGADSQAGPVPAARAARPADPERRPAAMDGLSLIVVIMPAGILLALCTGTASQLKRIGAAARQVLAPKPCADGCSPVEYLYVPCVRVRYHGCSAQTRRWVQEVPIVKKTAKLIYYTSDSWNRREAVVSPGCISREQFEADTRRRRTDTRLA